MQHANSEHDYRDVLLKAASLVEEGWCQDVSLKFDIPEMQYSPWREDYFDSVVAGCAIGRLDHARHILGVDFNTEQDAVKALSRHVGESIPDWNDAPDRTADEVAETMRKTAMYAAR